MALTHLAPNSPAGTTAHPPELSDVDYFQQVLRLSDGSSDLKVEEHLVAKAAALGLQVPVTAELSVDDLGSSSDESGPTVVSHHGHGRTGSTSSNGTAGTGLTSHTSHRSTNIPATLAESISPAAPQRRSKSLTFSTYERYLSQLDPALSQPRFHGPHPSKPARPRNVFTSATRRKVVVKDIKRTLSIKLRRRQSSSAATVSCICCREDFTRDQGAPQTLPCGHQYCQQCLAIMISQSMTDESKMPPRCCTQPIPGSIVKTVLARDEQCAFLKAVLQYSTPWESRIFCPNTSCGEFVPPRTKIDPKHPFETACKSCKTRVCVMCKRNAHRLGQDCPGDWELEAVLKMGEKSGWRRCYKCRTLVELSQGCTHMTCRCKAQFCYICGAVWDPAVGCPNFCNGEEELERRRIEEEARLALLEAEKAEQERQAEREGLARQAAEKRTSESESCKLLVADQRAEMARFLDFERKIKDDMRARHVKARLALSEKHQELTERMKERHAKTEQHLEDRQVEAEIELRAALDQSERSVRIQLKHMEAYCKGLAGEPVGGGNVDGECLPSRQVTQKHLEQLSQQYRVRDGMEQRHQSQINVLREKQAKRMEELAERHEKEMEALEDRKGEETEDLAVEFANDQEAVLQVSRARRLRLTSIWALTSEIRRFELEAEHGVPFAPLPLPEWPPLQTNMASSTSTAPPIEKEEGGVNPTHNCSG